MCNCKCKNGATELDFLLPVLGGTAANAVYEVGLTQYTCGRRRLAVNDSAHPVVANLSASVLGTPKSLGNGAFCCEVQIIGTLAYKACNCCEPKEVYVVSQFCVPCSSAAVPTVTLGEVIAQPEAVSYFNGCCTGVYPTTNRIAVTTSLGVTTA